MKYKKQIFTALVIGISLTYLAAWAFEPSVSQKWYGTPTYLISAMCAFFSFCYCFFKTVPQLTEEFSCPTPPKS